MRKLLKNVGKNIYEDAMEKATLWDGAAALSFYVVLAIFPGLLVLFAISTYLPDQTLLRPVSSWWSNYIPGAVETLIVGVVKDLKNNDQSKSILSFGFLFALWTATSGVVAVMRQINTVYGDREDRTFLRIRLTALGISVALTLTLVASFLLLVIGQFVLDLMVFESILQLENYSLVNFMRILAGSLVFFLGFNVLYYWGPSRRVKVSQIWPGGLVATLLFLGASFIYSYYLQAAGDYSATYGSLGAAIGLLMWLYILSFVTLLGAEINKALLKKSSDLD